MHLITYKLSHDTGFAPNPFFGVLTLATCKPGIRLVAKVGDWIAGFSSRLLDGSPVGQEKLVYLMQVTEILPMADYFYDPRFQDKIPDPTAARLVNRTGDNIYRPLVPGANIPDDYVQVRNPYHWDTKLDRESQWDKIRDLSGNQVLVSHSFYYFGSNSLALAPALRPRVPRGQSRYGCINNHDAAADFLRFVKSNHLANEIYGTPHKWGSVDDLNWRKGVNCEDRSQ